MRTGKRLTTARLLTWTASAVVGTAVLAVFIGWRTAASAQGAAEVKPPSPSGVAGDPASSAVRPTAKVFFVQGRRFVARERFVRSGQPEAAEAVKALLAGPTAAERASGLTTALPRGLALSAVKVSAGKATVDLSWTRTTVTAGDVALRPKRAAQLVYTLMALPSVERVEIAVNRQTSASFTSSTRTITGTLDRYSLSEALTLPRQAGVVPEQAPPASARGVQKRLVSLRFLPAQAVNGKWDERTSHAVRAFQAWHGLARDAIVGPRTTAALENASPPQPAGKGRRVEVYRERGVTLLVDRSGLVRALHSSSGAPGFITPKGSYAVFRKERNSWSVPYGVWLPYASYFNRGIAFHGWNEVPSWPASHGCVRLPHQEAAFAYQFMAVGTPVSVS